MLDTKTNQIRRNSSPQTHEVLFHAGLDLLQQLCRFPGLPVVFALESVELVLQRRRFGVQLSLELDSLGFEQLEVFCLGPFRPVAALLVELGFLEGKIEDNKVAAVTEENEGS